MDAGSSPSPSPSVGFCFGLWEMGSPGGNVVFVGKGGPGGKETRG